MKAKVFQADRQEFVEFNDKKLGLGLQLPMHRPANFPTLATMTPLLSPDAIREIIEADDFAFGSKIFDASWITYQNGFGSCAAYGGASALSKSIFLGGQGRIDLSGDYLYSLVNGGRDRGSLLEENMDALLNRGVCLRETVDLGEIYRNKYDTRKADAEAKRFRGHELYAVPDEQSMATALAMRIPVVIAIHVTNRWRQFDADDILAPASGPGNHCEHLDDISYSKRRGCFVFRKATSHGADYSDDGYCGTTWNDHYRETSRYHMFYAVPSARQDPQGDNPPVPAGHESDADDVVTLIVKSSSDCVWCEKWKENEENKVKSAGVNVESGDVPGNGVPRFQLQVGGKKKEKDAYWSYRAIQTAIRTLTEG